MPARAAISSRLAPAKPLASTISRAAATRAARVRSRLPPAAGAGSSRLGMRTQCTEGIKYARYISGGEVMIESPFGKDGEAQEVGGRRLAMQRLGSGGPAVVS